MKKLFLLSVLMLLPLLASADAVEINGIYYNLIPKGNIAEVTSNPNMYVGSISIPESVEYEGNKYNVTSIGNRAFSGCSGITSISISNSVTSIGVSSFANCSGLNSIIIPNSVNKIGGGAFGGCSGLTTIIIPNSVTIIDEGTFFDCSTLNSITIPNNVTSIGNSAFENCSSLTSVTIPNSVISIGESVFSGCSNLTSVIISNNLTSIGKSVFQNCYSLTSLNIPSSVTYIGDSAFQNCTNLSSVTIPNSVTSIGRRVFSGCSGLTTLTIPNSVTDIGFRTFAGCSVLTSVSISNGLTVISNALFSDCRSLTSVTIPNSVTEIGSQVFLNCINLISVTIGRNVKSIGYSFQGCSKLTDVYCLAEDVPNTDTDAFKDSYPEYMTLHVPANSLDAYKTTAPWSSFDKIVSLDGSEIPEPETNKCATPTISYGGKKLTFNCETEGVEYVYEIKDADVKMGYDSEVSLSATYEISVYATKAGYENSDIATAILVWGNASFTETIPEPSSVRALTQEDAALITSNNGIITVSSEAEGQPISVYAVNGQLLGTSTISSGRASVQTPLQPGSVAIVKIGDKSVKVVVK